MFKRDSRHSTTKLMCMADDTSEWQAHLEGRREGRLQTEKLARVLGCSEKKMGDMMLDPSSRRITSGKKQAKKEAIRQLGQSWHGCQLLKIAHYSLLEFLRGASNLRVIFRNYSEAGNLLLSAAAGAFFIRNHKNIQLKRLFDFSLQTVGTW